MPAPLEIHVPISPTPNFFNRIHYLAASLKRAGGLAAVSSLVVTVGADQEPVDLNAALPWSRKYPIKWRWLDRNLYQQESFYATAVDRFRVDFGSPMALMLDADVLVLNDFGDLVLRIQQEQSFCGAIAHISPFWPEFATPRPPEPPLDQRSPEEWWEAIFDRAGLDTPPLECEHGGWNVLSFPTSRYSPPYFNLGVLLAPAELFAIMGRTIFEDMATVDKVMFTFFRCQIGVTLSLIRSGWPYSIMPLRYNFPNYIEMAEAKPGELQDIRIIHYMNQEFLKKDVIFNSVDNVGDWLGSNRNLSSVHRILGDCLVELHPCVQQDLRLAAETASAE